MLDAFCVELCGFNLKVSKKKQQKTKHKNERFIPINYSEYFRCTRNSDRENRKKKKCGEDCLTVLPILFVVEPLNVQVSILMSHEFMLFDIFFILFSI